METPTTHNHKQHSFTNTLITISLQLSLWSSLFPLSVQISLLALHKVDKSLFLTDVICIAAVSVRYECDHTKHILIHYTGWNIHLCYPPTHSGCETPRERLQPLGQGLRSDRQGHNSLLFMYSSAVMDHNCRAGHNLLPRQTANMSSSRL